MCLSTGLKVLSPFHTSPFFYPYKFQSPSDFCSLISHHHNSSERCPGGLCSSFLSHPLCPPRADGSLRLEAVFQSADCPMSGLVKVSDNTYESYRGSENSASRKGRYLEQEVGQSC